MIYDMKKFFRKIAKYVVTVYANRIYRKGVKIADQRHKVEKEMIYMASSMVDVSRLVTLNRRQFRFMKRKLFIPKHFICNLKDGAWYHTADRGGQRGLTEQEKEIRRLAFVRHILHRAGLLDK